MLQVKLDATLRVMLSVHVQGSNKLIGRGIAIVKGK